MRRLRWQSVLRFLFNPLRRPRTPKRPTTFRPNLEALEDLVLPSTVTAFPTYIAANPLADTQASSAPVGLTPSQVRHAYGFDQITFNSGAIRGDGSGQTIAIVDAYDDPSIVNDLAVFDQQFGLPAPPSFTKVGI